MKRERLLLLVGLCVVLLIGSGFTVWVYQQVVRLDTTYVQAVTARSLDANFNPIEPTDVFFPDEALNLSVRLENVPPHTIVSARWFYEDREILTQDQVAANSIMRQSLGFELQRTDQPWPEGAYRVEVMLNAVVMGEVLFTVRPAD
ncbi:hypothetical protein ACFLYO_00735 [Chloroflexota bacterium]